MIRIQKWIHAIISIGPVLLDTGPKPNLYVYMEPAYSVAALWFFFLGWSLRNLNYIQFNKETTLIYQHHKKKKKHTHTHKYMKYILQFFVLIKKKKRLIRDKVEVENADMWIIKWLQ